MSDTEDTRRVLFRHRLLAHYSVSCKMAFPDHLKDIGLPFDGAYALAVQMRASG